MSVYLALYSVVRLLFSQRSGKCGAARGTDNIVKKGLEVCWVGGYCNLVGE